MRVVLFTTVGDEQTDAPRAVVAPVSKFVPVTVTNVPPPEEPVEVVSYRLRGSGIVAAPPMPQFKPAGTPLAAALRGHRQGRFDGMSSACPVYQRERVDVGSTLVGPAILDQFDCTTVVCPGQTARVDAWRNLMITEDAP